MRVVEDWGDFSGRIEYPNEVAYCNMPMLVRVTDDAKVYVGAAVSIVVNGETYAEVRELRDGACVFDIARYAQMAFVGKSVEYVLTDYQDKAQTAPTAQEVELFVRMTKASGEFEDAVQDTICVVYGRLAIGETSGITRRRKWFVNLPQTFDFLSSPNTDIYLDVDGAEEEITKLETYANYGQVYVNLSPYTYSAPGNARKAQLRALNAPIVWGTGVGAGTVSYELEIDRCTSGVYLRWLDRRGQWCYYLFRVTGQTYNTSVVQEWQDGIVRDEHTIEQGGVYLASGQQYQQLSDAETLSLGAKLVDAETFDFLLSLTSASLVDMMVNKDAYVAGATEDAMWERVQIVAGSYARTAATLQDFVVSIKRRAQKGQML